MALPNPNSKQPFTTNKSLTYHGKSVWDLSKEESAQYARTQLVKMPTERSKRWSSKTLKMKGGLPICPYGCGREGTLLEIVKQDDGRYVGIFNDHPCSCVFIADIEVGEPPTKQKYAIGADGELHLTDGD